MSVPKFKLNTGDNKKRRPGEAPRSVDEMAWAQQQPKTSGEMLMSSMKLIVLALIFFVLIFQLLQKPPKATPKTSVPATAGTTVAPPEQNEPSLKMVGPDGALLGPEVETKEEQPPPATDTEEGDDPDAEGEGEAEKEAPSAVAPSPAEKPKQPEPKVAPQELRKSFSFAESKQRKFKTLIPKFEPLENLDPNSDAFARAYDAILDDQLDSRVGKVDSSDLGQASRAVFLFTRFLRTNKDHPEKVEAYYQKRKSDLIQNLGKRMGDASHHNVMVSKSYQSYRGHPFKFKGGLIKKLQIRAYDGSRGNNAGLRDMWMLILRDSNYNIFSILVPQGMGAFASKDEVDAPDQLSGTGLFVQRWSYPRQDLSKWESMPVYVALSVSKVPPVGSGMTGMLIVLSIIVGIGLVFIVRQMKSDDDKSNKLSKEMRQRAREARKARKDSQETA